MDIKKIYSNFYNLYQELIAIIPDVLILPRKTLLKVTDKDEINQRRIS